MGSKPLILLDTHALIWLDQDDPALGPVARQRADVGLKDKALAVSAISFWEVAMLVAKGRITMEVPIAAWRQDLLTLGLIEIPVTGEIGTTAVYLEHLHNDPADRMIVATALLREAILLTADRRLLGWSGKLERQDARL
jgi:PIN domain nuclease of toxin-antitoxin system